MTAVVVDSAVYVECFGRKPCWAGRKRMYVSILGSRSFYCGLATGHSRLIGQQFVPVFLSLPCFMIGMIFALCNISCICLVDIEDASEIVDGTLSEFLEVEDANPVWPDGLGQFGQSDCFSCVDRRERRRSC